MSGSLGPGSLTPIRIRGKKRPRHGTATATATGTGTATATGTGSGRKGRRLLSMAERNQSIQNRQRKRENRIRVQTAAPTKETPSQLERLPVELVEKIFIYSLNADFARASPYLAAAVSSERMYRLLLLAAFSWDGPVTTGAEKILRYDSTPVVDVNDRVALQDDLLRCRWCTADRLDRVLPELAKLAVQRFWLDEGGSQPPSLEFPGSFDGSLRGEPYTVTMTAESVTIAASGSEPGPGPASTTKSLVNLRALPARVFDSPSLLEILRVSGGLTSQDNEHMRTVAQTVRVSADLQGAIRRAVTTANIPALRTLFKVDEYIARCENVARPVEERLPYVVPAEFYRLAVRQPLSTAVELMFVLLRANAESVPDDAEITAFAMQCCENNQRLGPWLLDFMLDLPRRRDEARTDPSRGLFYLGRPSVNVEWDAVAVPNPDAVDAVPTIPAMPDA